MRLLIVSDLHTEIAAFPASSLPAAERYDVAVLAGDITTKGRSGKWASQNFTNPTVLVAGNHEAYDTSLQRAHRLIRRDASPHVHFLEHDVYVVSGMRFIGCTAWSDLNATGSPVIAAGRARALMNDYRFIRFEPAFRRLSPFDTQLIAQESRKWLFEEASRPFDGKTVVVTHHPPLDTFIPATGTHEHDRAAIGNHWPEFLDLAIDLWVFGHTHERVDTQLGSTRFISNPRGYPDEEVNFDPHLIVEI